MKKNWTKPGVTQYGNVEALTLQVNKVANANDGLTIGSTPIGIIS